MAADCSSSQSFRGMATHSKAPEHFDYHIETIPDRIAILASGGLDSSVMLGSIARSGRQVYPVYIRTGLRWESHELATLRRFVRALRCPNIAPIAVLKLPMSDLAGDHWSMTGRGVPGYDATL